MTRQVDLADLACGETSYEFEGCRYGDAGVPFILVGAPPGSGPKLHKPSKRAAVR